LIISVVAMGIVLVYRSSRVINFAVGDLGVPATAMLAVMAGVRGWPYWPSFVAALLIGAGSGAIVEVAGIRRLASSPRVIVQVGPDTLLKAFAAALIGGMVSFPRAMVGALLLGMTEQFFRQNVEITDSSRAGLTKFALLVLVLVLVARASRQSETGGESFQ